MKVLATYNIKGGVGKTATAVNLAYEAASRGQRVLVWDLDPQGAATFYFRIRPKVKGGGRALVSGQRDLDEVVKASDYDNLDVVPADFSMRNLDLLIEGSKKPLATLRRMLRAVRGDYDLVFLDCPPSISLASESVFRAADALLVPVIPTTLSIRTFDQLDRFVETNPEVVEELEVIGFFSMVDRRKRLHRELVTELRKARPDLLDASIPSVTDIERMGVHRQPVSEFSPGSRASRAYSALWDEIATRL
ncbi:MAG TPA: ParA family protein [Acidimicrobiales bacterium]